MLDSWRIVKHRTGQDILYMETGLPSPESGAGPASPPVTTEPRGSLVLKVFELLADHCVHPGEREKFVEKVNAILMDSTLNTTASIDDAWKQSWDKPLYANQNADLATKLLERMRSSGPTPFDDFRAIRGTANDLKGFQRYTLKYRAIVGLAAAWPRVFERHDEIRRSALEVLARDQTLAQTVDQVRAFMGVPTYRTRDARDTLFHRVDDVWGFAKITTLHLLLDLGYPLYKADRWLVRFAAVDRGTREEMELKYPLRKLLEFSPQELLPHLDVIFRGMDKHTSALLQEGQPEGVINLTEAFHAFRFCDLMVAKFGMTPEASFGLARSGVTALLNDAALAARYPELHRIALEMSGVGSHSDASNGEVSP